MAAEKIHAHQQAYGRGTYDGKELGQTSHRPGAYAAFTKPSLIGDKRIPHKTNTQQEAQGK